MLNINGRIMDSGMINSFERNISVFDLRIL